MKALVSIMFACLIVGSPTAAQESGQKQYICPMYCTDSVSTVPDVYCSVCKMKFEDKAILENPTDHKVIPSDKAYKLMQKESNLFILDVRSRSEFRDDGHIANAVLIPVNELKDRLGELTPVKSKTIIAYCSHGIRSARAATLLQKNGFTVLSLIGGTTKWTRDKFPVVYSGSSEPAEKKSRAASSPSTSLESGGIGQLQYVEKNVVDLADAMPEDKFDFTPESLNIPGSAYKGVRTFAGQVRHLATDNYDMWCAITGDPLPAGIKDVNGPADIKSKVEIMKYLKGSFAVGHKAISSLTAENALEMIPFRGRKMTRLELTIFALTHSQDHFGQMVVYLRMAGIVPPGSRPR